jgi:hypothetical protein
MRRAIEAEPTVDTRERSYAIERANCALQTGDSGKRSELSVFFRTSRRRRLL